MQSNLTYFYCITSEKRCNAFNLTNKSKLIMPTVPNIKDTTRTATNHSIPSLLETIQCLQQNLLRSRDEKNRLSNQLSCLISLIKRSWMGDKVASYHVANIIGIPAPKNIENVCSPTLDSKTRAVMNWERFSLRLLDKEYQAVQEEIKERQKHYINYRTLYMDEILNSHQEQMSQLALHKSSQHLNNVDKKFVKSYKSNSRPPTGKGIRKTPSATKRPGQLAEDIVNKIDIGVHDILFNKQSQLYYNEHNKNGYVDNQENERGKNGNYDDSQRYTTTNLFNTEEVLGREAFEQKKRPLSATELRQKDKLRSRPKSAIIGKTERPLKYETTKPISGKTAYNQIDRRGSLEHHRELVNDRHVGDRRNSISIDGREAVLLEQAKAKAELKARIDSVTERSKSMDTFMDDMKSMTDMEIKFKQTAVDLQKKLGIKQGMIY